MEIENIEDLERKIKFLEEAKDNGTLCIYPSGMLQAFKETLPLIKKLTISATNKPFTVDEVVNGLEGCETLDDAIMFFKEQM